MITSEIPSEFIKMHDFECKNKKKLPSFNKNKKSPDQIEHI
jgi:hypothetical protein